MDSKAKTSSRGAARKTKQPVDEVAKPNEQEGVNDDNLKKNKKNADHAAHAEQVDEQNADSTDKIEETETQKEIVDDEVKDEKVGVVSADAEQPKVDLSDSFDKKSKPVTEGPNEVDEQPTKELGDKKQAEENSTESTDMKEKQRENKIEDQDKQSENEELLEVEEKEDDDDEKFHESMEHQSNDQVKKPEIESERKIDNHLLSGSSEDVPWTPLIFAVSGIVLASALYFLYFDNYYHVEDNVAPLH